MKAKKAAVARPVRYRMVETTMSAREKFILTTAMLDATAGLRRLVGALEKITAMTVVPLKPKPLTPKPTAARGRKGRAK